MYGDLSYTIGGGWPKMQVNEHKTASRNERLEARVSRETKDLFQKAASIQGRTLTEFVVNSALEAAKRTVQESEFMEMTYRDRAAFVETLLNAPIAPNARLRKAAKRYARVFPS